MTVVKAWDKCELGEYISRPSGFVIYKHTTEKPDMKPALERWIKKNIDLLSVEDMFADDWSVHGASDSDSAETA